LIGIFRSEEGGCPGISIDPEVLKEKEELKMKYVEVEFSSNDCRFLALLHASFFK